MDMRNNFESYSKRTRLRLFGLFLIAICSILFADDKGNIHGKIIDQITKQPLQGVNVIIMGETIGSATDLNGEFIINNVKENIYKLEISYVGYNNYIKTDVRVVRNKTTYIEEIELVQEIIEGETITISAGAFNENAEAPVSNYEYTREEIARSPGAGGDIFRAIETLPGVSTAGEEFSAFSVRGGNPRENIILVDNIPFTKVAHFEGGGSDEGEDALGGRFSIFSPGLIESAYFQAGGFPVKYGGKNASIINLEVKEGNRKDFTLNGYLDLLGWELNYNGPIFIHKNTSLLFSMRHQDLKMVLDMIDHKDEGDPRFTDVIFKTTTDINAIHKISVLGIYAPERFERNVEHVYESENLEDRTLIYQDETKKLLGINWRMLTGENSYLHNSFYYTDSDQIHKTGKAYPDKINGTIPNINDVRVRDNIININEHLKNYGIKSEFTFQSAANSTFSAGIELSQCDYDFRLRQNGNDTLYVFNKDDYRENPDQKYIITRPEFINTDYHKKMMHFAGYMQRSFLIGKATTVTPGIRYEYYDFNRKHNVSPRLSVNYKLSSKTSISAAAGLYYQAPEYKYIASNNTNNNLKNEKAVHYILGLNRFLKDDLKLSIEAYYKKLDDIIVRPDRTSNFIANQGNGWASGVDISLVKRFVDKFYGQVNYSYAVSKRNDKNGEGEYDSDFNQPHIFNVLFGYEFNNEWSISAKWKYATGRPKDDYILHSNVHNDLNLLRFSQEITGNNSERLADSHSLNIRVDYRKQFNWLAIIVYIDILNAYDHLNVMYERFIEVNGKDEERGFKMVPTFGIKLEI